MLGTCGGIGIYSYLCNFNNGYWLRLLTKKNVIKI